MGQEVPFIPHQCFRSNDWCEGWSIAGFLYCQLLASHGPDVQYQQLAFMNTVSIEHALTDTHIPNLTQNHPKIPIPFLRPDNSICYEGIITLFPGVQVHVHEWSKSPRL